MEVEPWERDFIDELFLVYDDGENVYDEAMLGVARKSGFAFAPTPNDWKLVRFEKHITVAPQDIPCASWKVAAASLALNEASAH